MGDRVHALKKAAAPPAGPPAGPGVEAHQLRVPTREERQRAFGDSVRGAEAKPRNRTGLPDRLKNGVEALSGLGLDDVRVHYGSSRPAALGAHAYTQGSEIHIAPGQEKHLPHEAWHVVQQKQGRVRTTRQMKSVPLNEDAALEREADAMGALAFSTAAAPAASVRAARPGSAVQRKPLVADPQGKMVDVATAPAAEVAALLDGFWNGGKKGKITEAVSVAALQRPALVEAVSAGVREDMIDRVTAKPRLLVELIGDLWKQGGKAVQAALMPELAAAAAGDAAVLAQLKAIGGHRLANAVQKSKTGGARAAELTEAGEQVATDNIAALTFAEAVTEEFKKKHVGEGEKVAEIAEEAHAFREETHAARVGKAGKAGKAQPSKKEKKEKKKKLRNADRAVSTRFLFPADEQALLVAELKALNERILERREPNPRALYRLTKNAYSYVSAYKQRGQETGKARFWFTVLGAPGTYQINHLDALKEG